VTDPERSAQAVEALEEAVDLNPDVSKGYSNLAIAYTRMYEKSRKSADAKEALAMFELALDVEPESVSLHTNYGILLAQVFTAPPYHLSSSQHRHPRTLKACQGQP
jgi:Tfp pilus assembly protein PilF